MKSHESHLYHRCAQRFCNHKSDLRSVAGGDRFSHTEVVSLREMQDHHVTHGATRHLLLVNVHTAKVLQLRHHC